MRDSVEMRILVSALLLAIFGDRKESKCSTGEELTSSFVPAGMQVVNHYLSQIRGGEEDFETGRHRGGSVEPAVPIVVVTYDSEKEISVGAEITDKLTKLGSALDEEAADQDLADCRGITSEVMRDLETSSRTTSRRQLSFILGRIVEGEVKNSKTKDSIRKVMAELEDGESGLSKALNFVTPLKYLSDLSLE